MHKILKFISFTILATQIFLQITYANSEFEIMIKDHEFYPKILEVPAKTKLKITVHNQDKSAEEFESFDLKREKIIPGNSKIKITLPPLKPGDYSFFGDFHQDTAQGILRVIE